MNFNTFARASLLAVLSFGAIAVRPPPCRWTIPGSCSTAMVTTWM